MQYRLTNRRVLEMAANRILRKADGRKPRKSRPEAFQWPADMISSGSTLKAAFQGRP
jgi:hypothetical protein